MKISIVMSAYNTEKYIRNAISSCMAQTYDNIELIVVEDKSTDSTLEILNNLLKVYDFTLIKHDVNKGAGQSRKDGIEVATGDYVITVDSDDTIEPDFIETLVKKAEETNADIVSGGITIIYSEDYKVIKCFSEKISTGFQKFKDYDEGKIVFLNNKIVRRSLYDKVPYCNRIYCEDTPTIFPLLYYANMVAYADTQGYNYLQHPASLCHRVNTFEQALFKALCCIDCIRFFADKESEYQGIVTQQQFLQYVKQIKANMTAENLANYKPEFAEVMAEVLKLISL